LTHGIQETRDSLIRSLFVPVPGDESSSSNAPLPKPVESARKKAPSVLCGIHIHQSA
jgi:hypothetical protein